MQLPLLDDFHIHLRQDAMMRNIAPTVRQGGIGLCMVMPNLQPPLTTTEQALSYQKQLQELSPNVTILPSLYLHPSLTPAEIRKAHAAGIGNVKSYPRGVTTNSDSGIEDYCVYYPVFEVMQECDMILNLHGEVPSDLGVKNICVMNAEERFLSHLKQLHQDFPRLRIILEHATSKAAVEMVNSLGSTVACTLTVHHLELVVDDWAGQPHHFCKPVAKYPADRQALRQVILDRNPKFFLGSDSAPHLRHTKECAKACAGVYTHPYLAQYLAHVLDSFGALDRMREFACVFGRRFYKVPLQEEGGATLQLVRKPFPVPASIPIYQDPETKQELLGEVVPFLAGKTLNWSLA